MEAFLYHFGFRPGTIDERKIECDTRPNNHEVLVLRIHRSQFNEQNETEKLESYKTKVIMRKRD